MTALGGAREPLIVPAVDLEDPPTKSANQRGQPHHADELEAS
jgi:hypothetical protein